MITVVLAGALSKMEQSITVSILKVDHYISDSTNSIVSIVAHVNFRSEDPVSFLSSHAWPFFLRVFRLTGCEKIGGCS